jgi:integrase
MADATDSKSVARKGVWVQVPPPVFVFKGFLVLGSWAAPKDNVPNPNSNPNSWVCETVRRANAVFSLLLYSGCRVGDLVQLELTDLVLGERSGSATFRFGKGGKQRSVPLPLPARRAIQAWLDARPPSSSQRVFIGCRGALTETGVRRLCEKYSALIGVKIHPHLLRHTMAKRFLADNQNDLVSLA